ncbi:MAG: DNA polymerase III subunit delta' [Syntrophaceae bacterium]|nr:DNA polymerase III subunit delta' [Syntrophaceae bacterium]
MSLSGVYGQEGPVAVLKNALEKNRVPHALLFCGAEGVGKRTAALAFAAAINCEKGTADACDACASCRKIARGSHPDVIRIEPEGQFIKVADIKELQERIRFRPLEGARRVVIIDEAERMNLTSANSLLKTLEEPSAANVFILVSSRPHLLPVTILSRCHWLRFNPLPQDVIAAFLETERRLAPAEARVLASSAGGSLGRALDLHRADYIALRDGILDRLAKGRLDPMGCLALAGRLAGEKENILEALEILKAWYRDILVFKETGRPEALIHRDRAEDIGRLAAALSRKSLLDAMRAIRRAAEAVERNANKALTLESMVFTLFADKAHFVEDSRRSPRAEGPGR